MAEKSYDVIIVGGGIMGSSAAYNLKRSEEKIKVAVVEMDPTYSRASSTLSLANIRIQFSLKENIQISQHAFEVLERFDEEMGVDDEKVHIAFHREGNLFLVAPEGRPLAERALALQKSLGCDVEWWTPEEIRKHYPLYFPSGYEGGTFGPKDGHLDAYAMLMGYKAKAKSLGAEYVTDEVIQIVQDRKRVTGVRLASGMNLASKAQDSLMR